MNLETRASGITSFISIRPGSLALKPNALLVLVKVFQCKDSNSAVSDYHTVTFETC